MYVYAFTRCNDERLRFFYLHLCRQRGMNQHCLPSTPRVHPSSLSSTRLTVGRPSSQGWRWLQWARHLIVRALLRLLLRCFVGRGMQPGTRASVFALVATQTVARRAGLKASRWAVAPLRGNAAHYRSQAVCHYNNIRSRFTIVCSTVDLWWTGSARQSCRITWWSRWMICLGPLPSRFGRGWCRA